MNSIQPASHGNFYQLYAIAAAVLGGCGLAANKDLGVLIGTAVMRVLSNSIILLGISTHLEFAIIGLVLLAGVLADVDWCGGMQAQRRLGLKPPIGE